MKKILLPWVAVMLICLTATAQEKRAGPEKKGFLTLVSGGPSFPLGDFKSKTREDYISTFTKTGLNFEVQAGYHLDKNFGIAGSVFYNFYYYDEKRLKEELGLPSLTPLNADHWKYYGITVGPMFSRMITREISVDFNLMTGVINANSPKVTDESNGISQTLITEDWSNAIPVIVSSGMQFQITKEGYFALGVNYFYAEPEFRSTLLLNGENLGDLKKHQPLSALSANIGFGLKF